MFISLMLAIVVSDSGRPRHSQHTSQETQPCCIQRIHNMLLRKQPCCIRETSVGGCYYGAPIYAVFLELLVAKSQCSRDMYMVVFPSLPPGCQWFNYASLCLNRLTMWSNKRGGGMYGTSYYMTFVVFYRCSWPNKLTRLISVATVCFRPRLHM